MNGNRVHAGFCYRSIVRKLILSAKVENNVHALALLLSMLKEVLGHLFTHYNSQECLVVAVPSSLRSRLYGRFNIAEAARVTLFPRAKYLASPLPGSFWRMKRAGRNSRSDSVARLGLGWSLNKVIEYYINSVGSDKNANDIEAQLSSIRSILVVDDVLTTGFTMGTLFDQLKMLGAQRIEGLVVASHSNQLPDF